MSKYFECKALVFPLRRKEEHTLKRQLYHCENLIQEAWKTQLHVRDNQSRSSANCVDSSMSTSFRQNAVMRKLLIVWKRMNIFINLQKNWPYQNLWAENMKISGLHLPPSRTDPFSSECLTKKKSWGRDPGNPGCCSWHHRETGNVEIFPVYGKMLH